MVLKAEVSIHLLQIAQIAALQLDMISIKVLPKYADYVDIFSSDLIMELPKITGINNIQSNK